MKIKYIKKICIFSIEQHFNIGVPLEKWLICLCFHSVTVY